MFKRVLLCYDGSVVGRRALKRGAELAILVGARVYVLSIIPAGVDGPAVVAGAAGHACLVDEEAGYRKLLEESIDWLKARGVVAEGCLASGNTIEQIVEFSRRLSIDLIVLGHYPQPSGGFWWGSPQRTSLAERAKCCVFVAVNEADAPPARRSSRGSERRRPPPQLGNDLLEFGIAGIVGRGDDHGVAGGAVDVAGAGVANEPVGEGARSDIETRARDLREMAHSCRGSRTNSMPMKNPRPRTSPTSSNLDSDSANGLLANAAPTVRTLLEQAVALDDVLHGESRRAGRGVAGEGVAGHVGTMFSLMGGRHVPGDQRRAQRDVAARPVPWRCT